jgi:hypothetical protein
MSNASKLRAFAISVEQVVRLLPQFAARKALPRGEADHLARQLQAGAEATLDIASQMDRAAEASTIDDEQLHAATAAMLNSPAWPAVFKAGSAEVLARAALSTIAMKS